MLQNISRYLLKSYLDYLRYLDIHIITFTKSNCLTYKCSKNTIIEVYCKKAPPPRCVTMLTKVLCIFYYSKIANTGHHSYMFGIVHNSIQKITNISIMKPIILISILNKYLDNLKYLDNRTPLIVTRHCLAIL